MTPDREGFVKYCSGCNSTEADCNDMSSLRNALKCCPDCKHEYVKLADLDALLAAEWEAAVERVEACRGRLVPVCAPGMVLTAQERDEIEDKIGCVLDAVIAAIRTGGRVRGKE